MPEMVPVATQIKPPNPGAGLGMLSSIIALKQQQQNLQTGQYRQEQAAAEAGQAQQQNSELQALGRFTVNAAKDPSYQNPDGTPNVQKYQQDAMAVAPVYGQQYIGQMTSNFNAGVENRKALLSLGAEQQQKAAGFFGAIAAKPGATPDDLLNAAEQARSLSDDPGYQRTIDRMLMHAPQTAMMPSDKASETIRQYARQVALQANAPQASESSPAVQMVQGPNGLVPANVNPQSPNGTGPVGAAIPNAAPPAIVSPPGGIPTVTGPGGSSPRQVGSSAPGPAPTNQDWENFGAYQSNLNSRVAIASDSIPRIQAAEKALDAIRGGAGAATYAAWAKRLQAIGAPQALVDAVGNGNLAQAQEAEKYLFQTTFSGLRQSMQGDPARVAEFQSAEKIFPSIGTDPRAAKNVLNFMVDQGQRDYAEQQALNTARKNGSFNPATWQADYQERLRAGKVPGVPSSQIPGSTPKDGTPGPKSKSGRATVYRNGRLEYAE